MKLTKYCLIIFSFLYSLHGGFATGQAYRRFVEETRKQIFQQSQNLSFPAIERKEDIVPIPQGFYAMRGKEVVGAGKLKIPYLDSFAVYAVIKRNDTIIGIAENIGTGKYGFMTRGDFESIGRKQSEETTIQMISTAFTQYNPASLYFVYFFPEERSRHELLAFISKGRTYYIDRKLKIYKNLRDCIVANYNLRAFEQQMDDQFIKWQLKKDLTLPLAKQMINEDYSYYTINNPTDTAGIMERFIKEIRSQSKMPEVISNRLQVAILEGLPTAPVFNRQKKRVIRFLDKDIAFIVAVFLTERERDKYDSYRNSRKWILQKAWQMIQAEPEQK